MQKKSLYRKAALDKLQSPERLNQMVKITTPKSWLALLGMIGILAAFTLWAFFGSIPKKVHGKGILIRPGGVIEMTSLSRGRIEKVLLKEGDIVKKGDTIAVIQQPELELQIKNTKIKLEELRKHYNELVSFDKKDVELKKGLLMKERRILNKAISQNRTQIDFVDEQIMNQQSLLKEGLITQSTLHSTQNTRFQLQQESDRLRNQLKGINVQILEMSNENFGTINSLQDNILELESVLAEQEARFDFSSVVKSFYNGKIVEVMVNQGEILSETSPVVSIEVMGLDNKLEAIVYVAPSHGKLVDEGMEVKISPSTVEKEEFGYIEGTVLQVSEYPATKEGIIRVLGNSDLVQTFTKGTPPIAVLVELKSDSTTFSKYKWTSKIGPDLEIKSGTFCDAGIIVQTQRPISLLFPGLKKDLHL